MTRLNSAEGSNQKSPPLLLLTAVNRVRDRDRGVNRVRNWDRVRGGGERVTVFEKHSPHLVRKKLTSKIIKLTETKN